MEEIQEEIGVTHNETELGSEVNTTLTDNKAF